MKKMQLLLLLFLLVVVVASLRKNMHFATWLIGLPLTTTDSTKINNFQMVYILRVVGRSCPFFPLLSPHAHPIIGSRTENQNKVPLNLHTKNKRQAYERGKTNGKASIGRKTF